MKRDAQLYLDDIFDCIDLIKEYTEDMSESDFLVNTRDQDAIIRRLEIIGEAANHIPKMTQEKFSHIPWGAIIGFRNIIVHGYYGVTLESIWDIATKDIYKLEEQLKKVRL